MMKILNIILSALSLIIVVLTIIFEGKLKKENKGDISLRAVPIEIKKISWYGWLLLSLLIIFSIGNDIVSYTNIVNNDRQYADDTVRYIKLINQLNEKALKDSITILNLQQLVSDNGLKSDSIKLSIVDNAVAAMDEQKKAIEKERENIFLHMQNEVEDNLKKILIHYNEERIKGFADTSFFISTRLKNEYIKKYEAISSKDVIIDHLMETAEAINTVNTYAVQVLNSPQKSKIKETNIRMFLSNVESTQRYLYSIYNRVYKLESYKQYESTDFTDTIPPDRTILNEYILMDYVKQLIY